MTNANHFCNILDRLEEVLSEVEGVASCQVSESDLSNPPEEFEVNIVPLTELNETVSDGSGSFDPFGDNTTGSVANLHKRGIMIEIFRKGRNLKSGFNMYAKCLKAIETDSELLGLVDNLYLEGDEPMTRGATTNPYIFIAFVISLEYSTPVGDPSRRLV